MTLRSMPLREAQAHMIPETDYLLVMVPPLVALADSYYKPSHMVMGIKMDFMEKDPNNQEVPFRPKDPKKFKACVVRSKDGEIVLTGGSQDYPEAMPTKEELSNTLIKGEIKFLYE